MTRDDIIRMAREADINLSTIEYYQKELEWFAALVAAAEREACAQIVECEASQYAEPVWAVEIVNDIRARGQAC